MKIEQSYWTRAIKLDPSWPLDAGPRPKSGKSMLNLHGTISKGKSIGLNQKTNKKEFSNTQNIPCMLLCCY
jgi:hypothetical protein